MSVQANLDQTHLPPIEQHARDRWHQRTPANRPLKDAWLAATPVEAPAADCEYARLYGPYNALMPVKNGWLQTVLINDGRLEKDGLVLCESCADPVDPISNRECPSCGDPQPSVQTCGQITVIRGGEAR